MDYSMLPTSNNRKEKAGDHKLLEEYYTKNWNKIKDFMKQHPEDIKKFQFKRIQEIVNHAFHHVPMYKEKYSLAGFEPGDLKTWEDFRNLPILYKEELIDAFPNKFISSEHPLEFTTRSSGSSGQFVTLAVSKEAVIKDTIQGVRQFSFQSNNNYTKDDLALFIYTSPWWFGSINGKYKTEFIPTTTSPEEAYEQIKKLRPKIISTYPTYLERIAKLDVDLKAEGIELIVVHSEQSSEEFRKNLTQQFSIPVLDEFSSEELTRISLECPHRKYHVEEDAVYVEVVDLENQNKIIPDGLEGALVGTNLLNEATPIIRYFQGDISSFSIDNKCECESNGRIMNNPEGRIMDSFTFDNKIVPASCFMDLAYNWYLELDVPVHGMKYQIIQRNKKEINLLLTPLSIPLSQSSKERIKNSLYQLVPEDTKINLQITAKDQILTSNKYRPVISHVRK